MRIIGMFFRLSCKNLKADPTARVLRSRGYEFHIRAGPVQPASPNGPIPPLASPNPDRSIAAPCLNSLPPQSSPLSVRPAQDPPIIVTPHLFQLLYLFQLSLSFNLPLYTASQTIWLRHESAATPKMQSVRRQAIKALRRCHLVHRSPQTTSSLSSSYPFTTLTRWPTGASCRHAFLSAPWAAVQSRGAKMLGSDVRLGNVIQRKGRIYQVIKAQHTHQGRGGAIIQVELRDVDTGNKTVERFRTDEAIEKVFVEERTFTFLYKEGETIMLMEPETFEQLEVSQELFGKNSAYLKEDMAVTLQYYDGRPMSASVPTRVTCTVVEARSHTKGLTAAPQYKRVVLDNGLTIMAPPFINAGDEITVNTMDDSYITRAKE